MSQYQLPRGATVLPNPEGTAPGLLIETEDVRVVLLPGVPGELRAIVEGALQDRLTEWTGGGEGRGAVHHRVVHTAGIFETKLAEALEPTLAALPDTVTEGIDLAYLPDLLGVDLRFTVRGVDREAADQRFDTLLQALDGVLGPWRFEAESGDLAEAVVRSLREAGWTLAVAESCTGGLLGKRITDIPGASSVLLGGVIAYSNDAKVAQVDVDPGAIRDHGAVSEAVAEALARGVAGRFGARVGVGITGVAGPGGGTPEKPVGTVWIGVSVDGSAEAMRYRFPGSREQVRVRAAQAALVEVHRRIRGSRGDPA